MKSDLILLLENAQWPVLIVDAAASVCQANKAAAELFGLLDRKGEMQLSKIWSPQNPQTPVQFLDEWERHPAPTACLTFLNAERKRITSPVAVCGLLHDSRRCFVLQLLPTATPPLETRQDSDTTAQKQKLECALQLARTVALDFNNALTSILGHTSLVLSKMAPTDPWRSSLLEVEKSAARAAEIANDLGAFSRPEKEARAQMTGSLNQLLQRTAELMQHASDKQGVQWRMVFERKLLAARFDEAKMQQAFIKILENALEALDAEGCITIQTRNFELSEQAKDRGVQLAPGTYVCAEISDNGKGIQPEFLPRIFEPFFTTKGAPHRGVGLAWVYGIVTNHGGGVAVSSQTGVGTSVRVYLPAEMRLVRDETPRQTDLSGKETVLMVDDEDLLLTMGQAVLSAYGYSVFTANSGQKALEILDGSRRIDLVITDLVMPSMSGRELIERIHASVPGMRVLCTSGYVRQDPGGEGLYLQKPFTAQELLIKVKQALG